MNSLETSGIAFMMVNGLMQTGIQTIALSLTHKEWPYYRLMAAAMPAVSMMLVVYLIATRTAIPGGRHWKKILARGCFSGLSLVLAVVAVRLGAPVGDVAALSSMNTVAAALLGRVFLREAIHRVHVLGFLFSGAGAIVLVVAGASHLDGSAIIGFAFAVLSGVAQGAQLICARNSVKIPPALLSCVSTLQVGAFLVVLVAAGIVDDFTLDPLEESPQQATAWYILLVAVTLASTVAASAGAQLCPAAVSATVNTGAKIVSSYLANVLIFGASLEMWPIAGAALMFASLVIMVFSRLQNYENKQPQTSVVANSGGPISDGDSCTEDDVSVESVISFTSFVSAEFAVASPELVSLQQRPSKKGFGPDPQAIGGRLSAAAFGGA